MFRILVIIRDHGHPPATEVISFSTLVEADLAADNLDRVRGISYCKLYDRTGGRNAYN